MRPALDSLVPLFLATLVTLTNAPALAQSGAHEADSIRAMITARRFGPSHSL